MTTIPLKEKTIHRYFNYEAGFNSCQHISEIFLEHDENAPHEAIVQASIPPSTTYGKKDYSVSIRIRSDGSKILASSCTCPIGYRCKHIHKVLRRIAVSDEYPLPRPSNARQTRKEKMKHAKVWIAMTCQSEMDRGDTWGRYQGIVKEEFDHEILGVFFSRQEADNFAEKYVYEKTGFREEYDDDEDYVDEEDSDSDDFSRSYEFSGEAMDLFDEDGTFMKVWVEAHPIEDASKHFRK